MKESIITAILAGCSLVMVIVVGVGLLMADRTAPKISLEGKNTLTYTEGDSYDVLLENMTAEDNRDGDVTESLRVSNLYVTDENKAVVTYVAKDEANNISKLKREVRYKAKEKPVAVEEAEEEPEEETVQLEAETTHTREETVQGTNPQAQQTEANGADAAQTQENQGVPKVTMIQNAATLKVGETFNVLRYVESAVDGAGNSLTRSLHVDGTYDMETAGEYQLQIYAIDGAGVRSAVETFTLTVEN